MIPRVIALGLGMVLAAAAASSEQVTFNKDVLPVLEKNCQGCHRPGEVGPMSFLTYKETRPWAKAIREAVLIKKMPPWFADPHFGKFSNDRRLSESDINTLVAWADNGAPEGDPKDMPKPVEWLEGWNIGQPDTVLEMPVAFPVPGGGVVEYQTVIIPTGFTEDKWIQVAEIRPGNRSVVHHVTAFMRPAGSSYLQDSPVGVPFLRQRRPASEPPQPVRDTDRPEYVVGYTPGRPPSSFPTGMARLIKAGSDIVLSLHYTPNGKPTEDRTKIGFIFATAPVKQRVVNFMVAYRNIAIPPGEPNYRVNASLTLHDSSTLIRMWPHMHTRGKSYEYKIVYPSGESQIVLSVPRYDFNWQLSYNLEKPLLLPKGTRVEGTAVFDNSPNNPFNPDPTSEVRWGDQSWDEMMEGYFDLAIDAGMNPADLRGRRPPPTED